MNEIPLDDAVKKLEEVIYEAKALGERQLRDGTRLIGRTPHVGEDAWLHAIFRPLDDSETSQLERELQRPIPDEYKAWLCRMNGLHLFSGSLALHGLQDEDARGPDAWWQPFDLRRHNLHSAPARAPSGTFFIGSYDRDGSLLGLHEDAGFVFRCPRKTYEILDRWPSVATMIVAEVVRLRSLFLENGDWYRATTPPVRAS